MTDSADKEQPHPKSANAKIGSRQTTMNSNRTSKSFHLNDEQLGNLKLMLNEDISDGSNTPSESSPTEIKRLKQVEFDESSKSSSMTQSIIGMDNTISLRYGIYCTSIMIVTNIFRIISLFTMS
jgi:hypothetical protein